MDNTKTLWIAVVVVAIIALMGVFQNPVTQVIEKTFGAFPGPDIYDTITFHQSYIKGGTTVATSSEQATFTLTTGQLRREVSLINWNVGLITTLTTMASSSAPFSNLRIGETISVVFYNASSTAAATATFAAGTGVDLQKPTGGGDLVIGGLDSAMLTFTKKSNTDILMTFTEYEEAD